MANQAEFDSAIASSVAMVKEIVAEELEFVTRFGLPFSPTLVKLRGGMAVLNTMQPPWGEALATQVSLWQGRSENLTANSSAHEALTVLGAQEAILAIVERAEKMLT
jgi:hypothetical protein